MKICLDLRTAGAAPHGIARYGIEMTRALQSLGTSHRLVLLTARGSDLDGLGPGDTPLFRCSPRPYSLEEQLLVPFLVARLKPDIYHCPTYACPLFVPLVEEGLFGYNGKNVITQMELEKRLKNGEVNAQKIVMIQCAGARDETREYCSRICCLTAVKNAMFLKKHNPFARSPPAQNR